MLPENFALIPDSQSLPFSPFQFAIQSALESECPAILTQKAAA